MDMRLISQKTHQYLRGIVGIDRWVDLAIALKSYADLRPTTSGSDMGGVYLMLMGYALEDLAKSIILCKAYDAKPTDVSPFEERLKKFTFLLDDGKKECKLTTHNLDELYKAKDLGFKVIDSEIGHLKFISNYTQWKGRYPVAVDIVKMSSSSEPSFDDLSNTAMSIYNRAMAEVERLRTSRS